MKIGQRRVRHFDQCAARYRWEHVDLNRKQKSWFPKHKPYVFGTYVHAVLEQLMKWVKETAYDGSAVTGKVIRRAMELMDEVPESDPPYYAHLEGWMRNKAEEMVVLYLEHLERLRHDRIVAIEEFMYLRTPDGHRINMFADRIDKAFNNDGEVGLIVVDYKASKGPGPDSDYARNSTQGRDYTIAVMEKYRFPKWVEFQLAHLGGGPAIYRVRRDRREIKIMKQRTLAQYDEDAARMDAGPYPTRTGAWCDRCPFKELWCPEWNDIDVPDWVHDPDTGRDPLFTPASDGSDMPGLMALAGLEVS